MINFNFIFTPTTSVAANVLRVRRDRNDHAKINSLNPEPVGSGKEHHETKPTTRLLYANSTHHFEFKLY